MTTGYLILGIGAVISGSAVLMTVIVAITAPAAKRRIEHRMREKY